MLSASSSYSSALFDSSYKLFGNHIVKVIIASFAFVACIIYPHERYKKFSKTILIISIILLLYTVFASSEIKGASRWINLGFFSFQPSELAKLALILHLASLIERKKEANVFESFKLGFSAPFLWIALTSAIILAQPNVSNAMIALFVGIIILFTAGARIRHIATVIAPALVAALIIILVYPHARNRISDYYSAVVTGSDVNVQVRQAKIALGSGGFFGNGLGDSRQSDLFLPEAYGDFIFSIVGEELGFLGASLILTVYFIIFFSGLLIAKKARDPFGQLLAFGISFSIMINAFINAAVVMGLAPTTGIPLPFISYGGSSVLFSAMSAGILINIAMKNMKIEEKTAANNVNTEIYEQA